MHSSVTPAPLRWSPATVVSTGCVSPDSTGCRCSGRLVGGPAAGTFRVGPAKRALLTGRRYHPASATVATTWQTAAGRLTLTDGMVAEVTGRLLPATLMVRRLTAEGGPVDAVIEFDPRLGERHRPPRAEQRRGALVCQWGPLATALSSSPTVRVEPGRRAVGPAAAARAGRGGQHRRAALFADVGDDRAGAGHRAAVDLSRPGPAAASLRRSGRHRRQTGTARSCSSRGWPTSARWSWRPG